MILLSMIVIVFGIIVWYFPALYATIAQYFFNPIAVDQKIVALTFDDGPNPPYTEQLLSVLQKHDVLATFFLVGKNVERYPSVVRTMVEKGHIIGNHSYNHIFRKYFTQISFESEITLTQKKIEAFTGKIPMLYRSPWLFRHPRLMKTVRKKKLAFVSGRFGSQREIRGRSGKDIAMDALQKVLPGMIFIFHDGFDAKGGDRSQTVIAIDLLILLLKEKGYQFVTADVLLGVEPYQ